MNAATDDERWMRHALRLAARAAAAGEVPVGAVVVRADVLLGEGWNRPIAERDPSAHAEIVALRAAGRQVGDYRLPGARVFVTLEPCPMCAAAMIHARIAEVLYGARDPKSGACGSVFDLLPADRRFNHHTGCRGGLLADACAAELQAFFRARRERAGDPRGAI